MAKGKGKGSQFEREFSRSLSLWWSNGERKDLFWRSAMSGGMSTVTGSKLQAGDITAVGEEGAKLMQAITFELKCGYESVHPFDHVDGLGKSYMFNDFIVQAIDAQIRAESVTWAVVFKRQRRVPLIFFPAGMHLLIKRFVEVDKWCMINAPACLVFGMPLEDFFRITQPKDLIEEMTAFTTVT